MKKLLFPTFFCGILIACNTSGIPNFENMSELELAEYNRNRNVSQMIVCRENPRSFSRVRRRHCATVEAMYGSVAQAEQLGVLNTAGSFINDGNN